MPEAPSADLLAKQSASNNRRIVSRSDRRMAKRPRTILGCPNVDLAIPDVVIALHDLAGIVVIFALTHFGPHALRVRRGLYFWFGLLGQRRNRLRAVGLQVRGVIGLVVGSLRAVISR